MSHTSSHKKTSRWIMGIIGIVILFGGYAIFSQDSLSSDTPPSGPTASTLMILENNINVGDISMAEGKKKILYTLQNLGTESVVLKQSSTSCMCTEAYFTNSKGDQSDIITMHAPRNLKYVVEPGEKVSLAAIFDPNAHGPDATGPISRSIYIQTNSTQSPDLTFTFLGNVVK